MSDIITPKKWDYFWKAELFRSNTSASKVMYVTLIALIRLFKQRLEPLKVLRKQLALCCAQVLGVISGAEILAGKLN